MKVVINKGYGGFNLSRKAIMRYAELRKERIEFLERHDPVLVKVIEELGKEANTCCSDLKIIELPNDTEYEVKENECGLEWIVERRRISS